MKGTELKIKVCGMRRADNIREISRLFPDYMGFIFYPFSKRHAGGMNPDLMDEIPEGIERTGVFVNSALPDIYSVCRSMKINTIQLHGDESPGKCKKLKENGFRVIKAFGVSERVVFSELENYMDSCDLFLFDTASEGRGGSGRKFDWKALQNYELDKPFFLSGGISPGDAGEIEKIKHPCLFGLDLNSGFEIEPGVKDSKLLDSFISKVRNISI